MEILCLFVVIFALFISTIITINVCDYIKARTVNLKLDNESLIAETNLTNSSIKYDEEEIIKHLDYIVTEVISEYQLYNIAPAGIYYINSKDEEKMLEYVKDVSTKRISSTLIKQISYVYNEDYIGEYIANFIYLKVTAEVIKFNTANNDGIPSVPELSKK